MQSDSTPGATPDTRPLTLTEALARFGDAWAGGDGPRRAAADDLRELRCPGAIAVFTAGHFFGGDHAHDAVLGDDHGSWKATNGAAEDGWAR